MWFLDGIALGMCVTSGPVLVSRTGDAGWTERLVKVPKYTVMRPQKGCGSIQTAGRWPWKSESAKDCVTTHLPNWFAPKMDGANRITDTGLYSLSDESTSKQAWWLFGSLIVRLDGTIASADLGGSSKYSNENFEGWSGEGFRVNSDWTWVSRFKWYTSVVNVVLIRQLIAKKKWINISTPAWMMTVTWMRLETMAFTLGGVFFSS